jgi:hypothetical protein
MFNSFYTANEGPVRPHSFISGNTKIGFSLQCRVREVTEAEKEKGEEKEGRPRRGMKGSSSVAHPRSLYRIPDPIFSFPDPGSWIQG